MSNIFILKDEDRRKSAIAYLGAVNITGRTLEVTIKHHKKNRTNAQNRLMWLWYGILGPELGYEEEDLHDLLKVRFLGVEEKTLDGFTLVQPKSTTKLTTTQFTEFLTKVEMLAAKMNILLPRPADLYEEVFTGRAVFPSANPTKLGEQHAQK